jgi:aminoglycoside 3-N-acetyltransferase
MTADYATADIARAIGGLGIGGGDTVYCHSNIGFCGRAAGVSSAGALCEAFFDAITGIIGPRGTLIVPTYTYSFPRKEAFSPSDTASQMGIFAEWVRRLPESVRSCDPSYSAAAIGADADSFVTAAPSNSFAEDSHFARLMEAEGIVVNVNFPGCTLIHQVERMLRVPYRFDKTFRGEIRTKHGTVSASNTIWVRYLSDDLLIHDPFPFVTEATRTGLLATKPLGRGSVSAIRAKHVYRLIAETLPKRPWFLTKADGSGRTPVIDRACT